MKYELGVGINLFSLWEFRSFSIEGCSKSQSIVEYQQLIFIFLSPNPLLSTCLPIKFDNKQKTILKYPTNPNLISLTNYQQLLITNMIKRNKPKNVVRLPRIPLPLDPHTFSKQDLIVQSYISKNKDKSEDSHSKENSTPKDLRNNTLYLEFPIGKKKCALEYPTHLKGQKLSEESMFATRAACSVFRRDVRARMFKYDEERAQSLTERTNNCCSVAEQLILRELIEKNPRKDRLEEKKKDEKQSESREKSARSKIKFKINENVCRWNDVEVRNALDEDSDYFFERMVEQSKFMRI